MTIKLYFFNTIIAFDNLTTPERIIYVMLFSV
jgi:hypothetical protein